MSSSARARTDERALLLDIRDQGNQPIEAVESERRDPVGARHHQDFLHQPDVKASGATAQ
jgi:hypothetical protein